MKPKSLLPLMSDCRRNLRFVFPNMFHLSSTAIFTPISHCKRSFSNFAEETLDPIPNEFQSPSPAPSATQDEKIVITKNNLMVLVPKLLSSEKQNYIDAIQKFVDESHDNAIFYASKYKNRIILTSIIYQDVILRKTGSYANSLLQEATKNQDMAMNVPLLSALAIATKLTDGSINFDEALAMAAAFPPHNQSTALMYKAILVSSISNNDTNSVVNVILEMHRLGVQMDSRIVEKLLAKYSNAGSETPITMHVSRQEVMLLFALTKVIESNNYDKAADIMKQIMSLQKAPKKEIVQLFQTKPDTYEQMVQLFVHEVLGNLQPNQVLPSVYYFLQSKEGIGASQEKEFVNALLNIGGKVVHPRLANAVSTLAIQMLSTNSTFSFELVGALDKQRYADIYFDVLMRAISMDIKPPHWIMICGMIGLTNTGKLEHALELLTVAKKADAFQERVRDMPFFVRLYCELNNMDKATEYAITYIEHVRKNRDNISAYRKKTVQQNMFTRLMLGYAKQGELDKVIFLMTELEKCGLTIRDLLSANTETMPQQEGNESL